VTLSCYPPIDLTSEYLLLGNDPVDPNAREGVWSKEAGPIASNLEEEEETLRELRLEIPDGSSSMVVIPWKEGKKKRNENRSNQNLIATRT